MTTTTIVGLLIALIAAIAAAIYVPSPFGWIIAAVLLVVVALAALGKL